MPTTGWQFDSQNPTNARFPWAKFDPAKLPSNYTVNDIESNELGGWLGSVEMAPRETRPPSPFAASAWPWRTRARIRWNFRNRARIVGAGGPAALDLPRQGRPRGSA